MAWCAGMVTSLSRILRAPRFGNFCVDVLGALVHRSETKTDMVLFAHDDRASLIMMAAHTC